MGSIEETQQPEPTPTPSPESTPLSTPVPSPAPSPAQTPEPKPAATLDPTFSSSVEIPAQEGAEGGEWDLLKDKLRQWFDGQNLEGFWKQWSTPIKLGLGLIALIIVLKIYSGIVSTIDNLPLISGLLELTGLIWLINFLLRNMIRSADRKNVISDLRSRWSSITGR